LVFSTLIQQRLLLIPLGLLPPRRAASKRLFQLQPPRHGSGRAAGAR